MIDRRWTALGALAVLLVGCGDMSNTADGSIRFVVVQSPAVIEEGFRCTDDLAVLFEGDDFVICGPESARDLATGMGRRGDIDGLDRDGDQATIDVPAEPTFYRHITPILEQHCWSCHHPDISETLPLATYDEVVEHGDLVREGLLTGSAPHRLLDLDGDCHNIVGLRQITPNEIATYMQWVDTGMVEGQPSAGVTPSPLPDVSADLTLAAPSYAPDGIERRCFLIEDPGVDEAAFITAWAFDFSAPETVINAYVASYPEARLRELQTLESSEAEPGWECPGNPPEARGLAGWTRGIDIVELPDGIGTPIAPDEPMVMVVTYRPSDSPVDAGFSLQTTTDVREPGRLVSLEDQEFVVPAGESFARTYSEESLGDRGIDSPTAIAGILPRMWERGVALESVIINNDGERCLADAPEVDFRNWSSAYFFNSPIPIAATDRITLECVFDTTTDSSPVAWGHDPQSDICAMALYVLE